MVDYNQVIFYNDVWEILENEKNDTIVREFIKTMIEVNRKYNISGGTYPTVEFVIGLVRDKISTTPETQEPIIETDHQKNERIRQARINFYSKNR